MVIMTSLSSVGEDKNEKETSALSSHYHRHHLFRQKYQTAILFNTDRNSVAYIIKHVKCTMLAWPESKTGTIFVRSKLYQILTGFQNCFTIRIRRKFVIILSLKIPPHLKCVATLPCEMSAFQ